MTFYDPTLYGRDEEEEFGDSGAYERVIGTVAGELDPSDVRNAGIVGLTQAPRNARGMVEYEADLFLLRPVDPAKGNRRLLFEVVNRGRKLMLPVMLQIPMGEDASANNPTSREDSGDGFLFRQGFTLAWAGRRAVLTDRCSARQTGCV